MADTQCITLFTSLKERCKVSLGLNFVLVKILPEPGFPIASCMKFDKVLYLVPLAQVCHSIWTAQEENARDF